MHHLETMNSNAKFSRRSRRCWDIIGAWDLLGTIKIFSKFHGHPAIQPHGGAKGQVRESPKLLGFIIWEPLKPVQTIMAIHTIVPMLLSLKTYLWREKKKREKFNKFSLFINWDQQVYWFLLQKWLESFINQNSSQLILWLSAHQWTSESLQQ